MIDKCRFCGLRGLVLSKINADYSCEHCGEWQSATLGSIWEITGYEGDKISTAYGLITAEELDKIEREANY